MIIELNKSRLLFLFFNSLRYHVVIATMQDPAVDGQPGFFIMRSLLSTSSCAAKSSTRFPSRTFFCLTILEDRESLKRNITSSLSFKALKNRLNQTHPPSERCPAQYFVRDVILVWNTQITSRSSFHCYSNRFMVWREQPTGWTIL